MLLNESNLLSKGLEILGNLFKGVFFERNISFFVTL